MDDDITQALLEVSRRMSTVEQQIKFAARGGDLESLIEAREQLKRLGDAVDMYIDVQTQRWIDRFQASLAA